MAKILRLFRSDNLKANFEDAKSALLAHEGKRADGEQIICRYMDTDGKVKSAIGIYATGQNNVGVTVIKCSDEIDKDINRVLDELDNTQKGAGLNEDGSYTAPAGDDILGDAISLFDADQKLADAIRKEIQDRIDAINALDYEDTEVEGQVVVSVSEQDGIVSNQKKKIKDIVLTDYQGKGEEGSLNISTETIGDAFGSIETYIKNLDVAPISAEGYAIVQVSEENGRISAETGTINAETVNIKDFNDIIDADNVEDALQEMKKQIDQVKLTSDDASVTITKPNDHKQPTDLGVNIKTGERLIRKDGNSGIYTNLTLEKLTSGLAANIREQYQVKDSYGIMIGEPINIYKDSALLSVALLHSTNSYKPTYNKNNGSWTDISDTNEVNLSLCFAYEDVNGDVQIIAIPVGNFLRESEFKDGLTVNVNGEVFVLIDPMSGKVVTKDGQVDVLTVSPTGVKVSNIQEAIDFLNENLTKALNDEIERAKDAEKALKDALDQEIQDRKDGDKNLEDALNAEIQRAKDAEETNKDNLADEIARAKKREDEIETNLTNYTDQKVTEEKNRAELAEQGLAHDIENEKSRAELAEQGLSNDISTERQRAIAEETRLEGLIKQEEQRAEKAEAANLEAAKSYTDTKVTEERNRAMAAESANLETAKTYTDTKFGEEKARAEKAESELKSAIDLEY